MNAASPMDQGGSLQTSDRTDGHTNGNVNHSVYFTPKALLQSNGSVHRLSTSSHHISDIGTSETHKQATADLPGRKVRKRRSFSRTNSLIDTSPIGTPNQLNTKCGELDNMAAFFHDSQAISNQTEDTQKTATIGHQRHSSFSSQASSTQFYGNSQDSAPYFFGDQGNFNPVQCDELRLKLKYFFMNPIEKWNTKKKFPWKLLLQVIKIIFVTIHLIMYGSEMSRFLNHEGNMLISFRELLLNNWDPVREVMAYPPAAGPYAVYTKSDFFESIDYAVKSYSNITRQSFGSFGYASNTSDMVSPIKVCITHYLNGTTNPSQFYYNFNTKVERHCYIIPSFGPAGSSKWEAFSFKQFLQSSKIFFNFDQVIKVKLLLDLRTIYLNSLDTGALPECYDIRVAISYDNSQHDGQLLINLKTKTASKICNGTLVNRESKKMGMYERYFLRILVVLLCITSFILCCRSLVKAVKLARETKQYFKTSFGRYLNFQDQIEFFDFWMLMIMVNDLIILAGTIIQHFHHYKETNYNYMICSILYGLGIFLVWTGLLRYLSFFKKYNVVIMTAKKAYPDVLRFSFCALLLYGAFCLCGWIVLGPYHLKFRSLSRTSECLFSLLNGDDMFATFATTDAQNSLTIWMFSRIYLYSFITLFIYIILSLFISIIMDAYETIKECYVNGMPLSDIQKFISDCGTENGIQASDSHSHLGGHDENYTSPETQRRGSMINSMMNCIRTCSQRESNIVYENM